MLSHHSLVIQLVENYRESATLSNLEIVIKNHGQHREAGVEGAGQCMGFVVQAYGQRREIVVKGHAQHHAQ